MSDSALPPDTEEEFLAVVEAALGVVKEYTDEGFAVAQSWLLEHDRSLQRLKGLDELHAASAATARELQTQLLVLNARLRQVETSVAVVTELVKRKGAA
jgi:hypothetical protein